MESLRVQPEYGCRLASVAHRGLVDMTRYTVGMEEEET